MVRFDDSMSSKRKVRKMYLSMFLDLNSRLNVIVFATMIGSILNPQTVSLVWKAILNPKH